MNFFKLRILMSFHNYPKVFEIKTVPTFKNHNKSRDTMGLFRRNKNNNKPVIRQILDLIPPHLLQKVTQQHHSDKGYSKYKTYDQFVRTAVSMQHFRRHFRWYWGI